MTTTTDTLTRWTVLWEQDDGLRPEFDGWKLVMWGREWSWICNSIYKDAPVGLVAMAIRDSAVRWLVIAWANSKIEYEVMCEAITSNFPDDALYAACKAVLGEEKT